MTDAEKFLQLMLAMGKEQKENQQAEMNKMGEVSKMIYDAYIFAGFTPKQAMEMTKAIITTTLTAGLAKDNK